MPPRSPLVFLYIFLKYLKLATNSLREHLPFFSFTILKANIDINAIVLAILEILKIFGTFSDPLFLCRVNIIIFELLINLV